MVSWFPCSRACGRQKHSTGGKAQGSRSVSAVRKPRDSIPSTHLRLVCPSPLAAYPAVDFNPLMKLQSSGSSNSRNTPAGRKRRLKQLSLCGPLCRTLSLAEQQSSLQSILNVLERRTDPRWTKLNFKPRHKCFLFPFCSACFHMVSIKGA